jgi:hypothetical protein
MLKKSAVFFVVLSAIIVLVSCGGSKDKTPGETPAEIKPVAQPVVFPEDAGGVAVVKEILDLYDKAVAETAVLVKDKPEAAELKPKLDALYENYKGQMAELNKKFLALKAKPDHSFAAANTYLGQERGNRVFAKDNTLSAAMAYYNFQKSDPDTLKFLSRTLTTLIDIAVKM